MEKNLSSINHKSLQTNQLTGVLLKELFTFAEAYLYDSGFKLETGHEAIEIVQEALRKLLDGTRHLPEMGSTLKNKLQIVIVSEFRNAFHKVSSDKNGFQNYSVYRNHTSKVDEAYNVINTDLADQQKLIVKLTEEIIRLNIPFEMEVFNLIDRNFGNTAIANELNIPKTTVRKIRTHLKKLLRDLMFPSEKKHKNEKKKK